MKTLDLTVEKLLAKLKYSKSRPNSKVKGKKMVVCTERPCHKEYSCDISKLYHSLFKNTVSKILVKLLGQGHSVKQFWYQRKGLVIKNTPVKYQSSSTHCS